MDEQKNGSNIIVAIRIRPLTNKERNISEQETVKVQNNGKVISLTDPGLDGGDEVLRKNPTRELQFTFDQVFDWKTSQEQVYENTTSQLIDSLLDGYNATVFSYGATGSGKTFTMVGGHGHDAGIMHRALQSLYHKLNLQHQYFKETNVKISYLEIYNEAIKDLLTQEDKNLDIREDKNGGVIINGITEIETKQMNDVFSLLRIGNKNRSKEATDVHQFSSRSHAILQVSIEVKEKTQGVQTQVMISKFSLVDLAGSERAANTNNKGIRMVEGAKINQSLLVLGNCIQALSETQEKGIQKPFIPYRNSKLTRLLKDSLGGNCRTIMIANISPGVTSFEETYNTLTYANRAKNIKVTINRNIQSVVNHISNYEKIIKNLRQENEELKYLIENQKITPQRQLASQNIQQQKFTIKELEIKIQNYYNDLFQLQKQLNENGDKENYYNSNLLNLQTQKSQFTEQQDEMRISDRMENINTQIALLQKDQRDIYKQYEETQIKKNQLVQQFESNDDGSNAANYVHGLIKQWDLKLENMKIKQNDKRIRIQASLKEQQIQILKNQLNTDRNIIKDEAQKLQLNRQVKYFQPSAIPGVNMPHLSVKFYIYIKIMIRTASKPKLKLPPVSVNYQQIHYKIGIRRNNYSLFNSIQPQSNNNDKQSSQQMMHRSRNVSLNDPESRRSSSKKQINKSVDQQLDNYDRSESSKKLRKLHENYQQERFLRAISGKRNQNSLPHLQQKILFPNVLKNSPYVKSFQQEDNINEEDQKKKRLKRLNLNLKDSISSRHF